MKIYSELLDKLFDTMDECINAEKTYQKEQEEKEKEKAVKAQAVSKRKKELADRVEQAEEEVRKAYAEYDCLKDEAKKILDESNNKIIELLSPAVDKIKAAQRERYNAIVEFNNNFGVYSRQYTGERAFEEFKRATSWAHDIINRILF